MDLFTFEDLFVVSLSACVSVCVSSRPSVYLSAACLSVCPFIRLSVYPSVYLNACLSCLSACPSVRPSICLSVCLSEFRVDIALLQFDSKYCLSVCLCICLSTCYMSVCLPVLSFPRQHPFQTQTEPSYITRSSLLTF